MRRINESVKLGFAFCILHLLWGGHSHFPHSHKLQTPNQTNSHNTPNPPPYHHHHYHHHLSYIIYHLYHLSSIIIIKHKPPPASNFYFLFAFSFSFFSLLPFLFVSFLHSLLKLYSNSPFP